jgi:hypothetical protein
MADEITKMRLKSVENHHIIDKNDGFFVLFDDIVPYDVLFIHKL